MLLSSQDDKACRVSSCFPLKSFVTIANSLTPLSFNFYISKMGVKALLSVFLGGLNG